MKVELNQDDIIKVLAEKFSVHESDIRLSIHDEIEYNEDDEKHTVQRVCANIDSCDVR